MINSLQGITGFRIYKKINCSHNLKQVNGKTFNKTYQSTKTQILLVGLDAGGKSKILNKLRLGTFMNIDLNNFLKIGIYNHVVTQQEKGLKMEQHGIFNRLNEIQLFYLFQNCFSQDQSVNFESNLLINKVVQFTNSLIFISNSIENRVTHQILNLINIIIIQFQYVNINILIIKVISNVYKNKLFKIQNKH